MAEIHFNMIFEINRLLKEKGFDYTMHSHSGCSSCGAYLTCEGEEKDIDEIADIINGYLKDKWLKVKIFQDLNLAVLSLFE